MLFHSNNKQIIGVLRFRSQYAMDFKRTSTNVIINPYAKHPAAATTERKVKTNNVAITPVVTDLNMGNQFQLRNGAIKKCKKMATKRLHKQVYK
jgi:ATP sulfurylase